MSTKNFGTARPRGTDSAKVIKVIETKSLLGCGSETDPCRIKKQYWSLDGQLLAEHDPEIKEAFSQPGRYRQ